MGKHGYIYKYMLDYLFSLTDSILQLYGNSYTCAHIHILINIQGLCDGCISMLPDTHIYQLPQFVTKACGYSLSPPYKQSLLPRLALDSMPLQLSTPEEPLPQPGSCAPATPRASVDAFSTKLGAQCLVYYNQPTKYHH